MFATVVLPNQLCGGVYKSEGEIKLFELLISVLLPISIQILILKLGEPNHVRGVFLRFGLSSKRHL